MLLPILILDDGSYSSLMRRPTSRITATFQEATDEMQSGKMVEQSMAHPLPTQESFGSLASAGLGSCVSTDTDPPAARRSLGLGAPLFPAHLRQSPLFQTSGSKRLRLSFNDGSLENSMIEILHMYKHP